MTKWSAGKNYTWQNDVQARAFLPNSSYATDSLEPGSKLCATLLNITKYFKTLRCGCGADAFIFSIYLKPVLYSVHIFQNDKYSNLSSKSMAPFSTIFAKLFALFRAPINPLNAG